MTQPAATSTASNQTPGESSASITGVGKPPDAAMLGYREQLIKCELDAHAAFDKSVMTLSAGALGVTFAFVEKTIDSLDKAELSIIAAAWACWVASLTCVLVSHYCSGAAMRHAVRAIDTNRFDRTRPGGVAETAVRVLNILGGLAFVAGVISAGLYLWSSLNGA